MFFVAERFEAVCYVTVFLYARRECCYVDAFDEPYASRVPRASDDRSKLDIGSLYDWS